MNAGWDEDLLRMELSDLINADFDVSLTGFIPTEIDELLTDVLPGTGNEEEPYTTKIDTPVYEPSGGKPDNRTAINSMFTSLSGELNELAIYEAGYQLSLFDSMLPDFVADVHPLVGISPDALYAAAMARPFQGRLLSEWASDLEADRLRRITNTVRQGFLLGDTNEQIARKIRGHVSKGFQDGALQMSRANAASIAKTAVRHLAATARESFASANNDLIKGKQWLSTLDNRTTPQCRIRDRLKYTLNNKPVGHSVPYLQGPGKIHFCCRSTETFILKSAKELGIDVRDISPAERASMDGVVAGDTTYREWFLRQPYTRQKQIVGETRAKLIRDGGMSPDEFYTDKGEWLTLKQLRERDAQVFRKAGI
ncbi:TPA: phage minor head protein [Escherichia coli]|uniref:phage minor head protein n=1 Tax=Escherichia coli TaxID=562 RepID=UPI00313AE095